MFRVHCSPQIPWRVNLAGSGDRLESELVVYLAVFRVHCSPPMDSELGGAQVRLESETSSCGDGGRDLRYPPK